MAKAAAEVGIGQHTHAHTNKQAGQRRDRQEKRDRLPVVYANPAG